MSQIKTEDRLTKKGLAQKLGIARSSLYYRHKRTVKDWQLKIKIEETLHEWPSYGHKRLAGYLKINKKRILRVMKLFGIKPYRRRGKKPWKKPINEGLSFPNLLLNLFPSGPNQIWVSDFTYLRFKGKFVYLATVMDIFTREIVGFSVSTSHNVQLIINALLSAVNLRASPRILHSDHGREYTSKIYTALVSMFNVLISMSRKGCPWENGYQESFYNQFKVDLGDPNRFDNLGELTAEIYQTIYRYNTQRIHSSLKMAPREYAMLKSSINSGCQITEKVS